MTRRRSRIALWALPIAALATVAWWGADRLRGGATARSTPSAPVTRTNGPGAAPAGRAVAQPPGRAPVLALAASTEGTVTVTGRVIDVRLQQPVGSVEIVFRSAAGETTTVAQRDGAYAIQLAPGTYRAVVRDDAVLSVGRRDATRLPGPPARDTAGIPDEALMATVIATRDLEGIDLSVVRSGVITGHVFDRAWRPIAGAMLRASGGSLRPALGTDVAESGSDGAFELRLPAGTFELEAAHPRFAGISEDSQTSYVVLPGGRVDAVLLLAAGCVITGRVVARDGSPAGDGAIERQWGSGELEFTPAGQIDADGAFRWLTTERREVTLRAWPWKAPPSPSKRFACRDGARFDGVVFRLPDRRPDLEGVLVDHAGQPLAFTFLDLKPLDADGIAQQERTDAAGQWQIYSVPPGRYRIAVQAEGRGVATTAVVSPRTGVRLELSGSGRLEGTAPRLGRGSFEIVLESCLGSDGETIALPQSRPLVTVTGGRFRVDDLPACALSFAAVWHGRSLAQHVAIPAGGAAQIALDLGEPRDKTVRGTVRDAAGQPVEGAIVRVVPADDDPRPAPVAKTDAAGAYTIKAFSGANLSTAARGKLGRARVGEANIDTEQVDLVIDAGDASDPSAGTDRPN